VATSDPIADIIGDYRAFAAMQRDRLIARDIDITPYPLSHLAVRVADWDLYVHQRTRLERHAKANRENLWNGRPISLIELAEPLDVLDGTPVSRMAGEFLVQVGGDVYSEEEMNGWLGEAGWHSIERQPLAGPISAIVAEAA
jgi:hypothetical protein